MCREQVLTCLRQLDVDAVREFRYMESKKITYIRLIPMSTILTRLGLTY